MLEYNNKQGFALQMYVQSIPKETHIYFFYGPSGGGGPKFHMVNYVNKTPIYIIHHVNF